MKLYLIAVLTIILAACSMPEATPPSSPQPDTQTIGVVKVSVTDRGQGADPEVKAEWVNPDISAQSPTVVNPGIGSSLGQLELRPRAFEFLDPTDDPTTRYLSVTLDIFNHTTIDFSNLTLYALNKPSNLGGTAIASLIAGDGSTITSTAQARTFKPTHGMQLTAGSVGINSGRADLHLATPSEATQVKNAAVGLGVLSSADTVLEYGFVARNLSEGRFIGRRAVAIGCTKPSCQGTVTLAYQFRKGPPASFPLSSNPASFSMLFVVVNENVQIGSQSREEQATNTVMGWSEPEPTFTRLRTLGGSTFGMSDDRLNNLCRVKTAVSPDAFLAPPVPSAPGSLDGCFGAGGKKRTNFGSFYSAVKDMAIQSDGKIVVAGSNNYDSNSDFNPDFALARFNPNGSLDTTFSGDGKVTTDFSFFEYISSLAIQPDGKIVVAGSSRNGSSVFALARYNTNGSLDTTFDTDGKVTTDINSDDDYAYSLALQSDGKIVVAGYTDTDPTTAGNNDFALVRYNTNGSLDTTFDTDGKVTTAIGSGHDQAHSLAIQSDGKIVVAGRSDNGSNDDFALVRYNPNGSLDTSLDGDGKVTTDFGSSDDEAHSLAIQSDGKIVVVGDSRNGSNNDIALVRYNSGGSLDTSFGIGGKVTTDFFADYDNARSVAIQSDGKVVVAGHSQNGNNEYTALVRYNTNGSLDTSFDEDGKVTTVFSSQSDAARAMALQPDGKIVVAGSIRSPGYSSWEFFFLARYNP